MQSENGIKWKIINFPILWSYGFFHDNNIGTKNSNDNQRSDLYITITTHKNIDANICADAANICVMTCVNTCTCVEKCFG